MPDLAGLEADALSVIAEARGAYEPLPGAQARVRHQLELSLAAGAAVTWYGAAASASGVKLIAAAVTVGLAGTGIWYAAEHGASRARSSANVTSASANAKPAFEANLNAAQAATEPSNTSAAETAQATQPPTHAPPRQEANGSSRVGDLAAETQALMQVNAAINRQDGAAALALLDDYDHRFKSRILFAERSAARVFALCSLKRVAAASAEAQRFLHNFPRSPLVQRIQASCAALPTPAKPTGS
jgi:hypothetical protein